MLGWEYPPHISGGLGTACQGLTESLAARGVAIDFVLPRLYGLEDARHMRLLAADPAAERTGAGDGAERAAPAPGAARESFLPTGSVDAAFDDPPGAEGGRQPALLEELPIPAFLLPYLRAEDYAAAIHAAGDRVDAPPRTRARREHDEGRSGDAPPGAHRDPAGMGSGTKGATRRAAAPSDARASDADGRGAHRSAPEPNARPNADPSQDDEMDSAHYGADLFAEVARFARRALARAAGRPFDLVHAHDWLTFPAGVALARAAEVPLVVHVHSLEHDRNGWDPDPRILALEREGLRAAQRVIAVSRYTRRRIHAIHGVPLERIDVVHNGVRLEHGLPAPAEVRPGGPALVLFLGRVTYQKGPDYLVEAAARVIPHVPDVRFLVAGSGDMLPRLRARVRELGIEERFRFPGFLRGPEVERAFEAADLYVMPSVSEPFGISALEAMCYDTPVILSKQSGASEVLKHALKVDFWDVDQLANLIIGALRHRELREELVQLARDEVRALHWDAAAARCQAVYREMLAAAEGRGTGG